jgi:hypothetical protein
METLVGFIAGYLAGCQDGKDGLQRLRESVDAIRKSPETRRLAGEAMGFAELAMKRAASSRNMAGLGGTVGTVTDILVHRAAAIGKGSRAA